MNSNASIKEIGELLRQLKIPLELDKDYINKLIRKIRGEQAKRIDYYTLNKKLAEFEDKMSESDLRLWAIITSPNAMNTEKIAALREVRNNNRELFDKMFDAGVFERKLGELNILTPAGILKILNEDVDKSTDKNNKESPV